MTLLLPRGLTVLLWAVALTSVAVTVPWRLMPVVAAIVGTGVIVSILTRGLNPITAASPIRGGRPHDGRR